MIIPLIPQRTVPFPYVLADCISCNPLPPSKVEDNAVCRVSSAKADKQAHKSIRAIKRIVGKRRINTFPVYHRESDSNEII
jgi:hypothetical protein